MTSVASCTGNEVIPRARCDSGIVVSLVRSVKRVHHDEDANSDIHCIIVLVT